MHGDVGIYVVAKPAEPLGIDERIRPYRQRFQSEFPELEEGKGGSKFVNYFPHGGARNFMNWDRLAGLLEENRLKYERILRG